MHVQGQEELLQLVYIQSVLEDVCNIHFPHALVQQYMYAFDNIIYTYCIQLIHTAWGRHTANLCTLMHMSGSLRILCKWLIA